jgi:hypothetical protein
MSKRRTAEEALNIPTAVQDFIEHGMLVTEAKRLANDNNAAIDVRSSAKKTDANVIDLESERAAPPISRRRSTQNKPGPEAPPTSLDDLTRTYAKATVQKTIRFHPKLIAELDAYLRSVERGGGKPVTFQSVQNEALALWLERNA